MFYSVKNATYILVCVSAKTSTKRESAGLEPPARFLAPFGADT
jgi:hypothetical protein